MKLPAVLLMSLFAAPALAAGAPPSGYKAVSPGHLDATAVQRDLPQLPSVLRGDKDFVGSYMVYVEKDGHVSRADVLESIPGGDAAVRSTILKWTFKPQPTPIRSVVRLTFHGDQWVPPGGGVRGTYKWVKQEEAADLATSSANLELPDDVERKLAGKKGDGRYVLYVSPAGKVAYVQVEKSIDGADEAIVNKLGTWTFKPGPVGIKFVQRVHFDVPKPEPAAPPASAAPSTPAADPKRDR
jgi:hypothetical protein